MVCERSEGIEKYGHHFKGKGAVVCCRDPTNLEWMCELMDELDVTVLEAFLDPSLMDDERVHHQSERPFTLNKSIKVIRERCSELEPDFVITDYRVSGLSVPSILVDKSKLNVFRYGNSIRMMWLQTMAPASAGWMEAVE